MLTRRILAVATNTPRYAKVGFRTGLWLSELTHICDVAEDAGYTWDLASPAGGFIPIDPESLLFTELAHTVGGGGKVLARYEDRAFMARLDDTMAITEVQLDDYDAIYLSGGHGVMFDFDSGELADLVARFHDAGKVVAAVCHGPAGLLNAWLADGSHLLQERAVTGFSWREEAAAKRDHAVPFNLEEELQRRGARYSKALLPFQAHVVEDGQLVTGQNPASAHDVAEAVLRKLEELATAQAAAGARAGRAAVPSVRRRPMH